MRAAQAVNDAATQVPDARLPCQPRQAKRKSRVNCHVLEGPLQDFGIGCGRDSRGLRRIHGHGWSIRRRWRCLATAAAEPPPPSWRRGSASARGAAPPRHEEDPCHRGAPDDERNRRPAPAEFKAQIGTTRRWSRGRLSPRRSAGRMHPAPVGALGEPSVSGTYPPWVGAFTPGPS